MYKGEEIFYTTVLCALLIIELLLTIPMSTDFIAKEGDMSIFIYLIGGHLLALAFAMSGQIDNGGAKSFHVYGLLSIPISVFPLIPFIWHGFVAVIGIKGILKMVHDIRFNDTIVGINDEKTLKKLDKENKLRKKYKNAYVDDDDEDEEDEELSHFEMERQAYLSSTASNTQVKNQATQKQPRTKQIRTPREQPQKKVVTKSVPRTKTVVKKKVVSRRRE